MTSRATILLAAVAALALGDPAWAAPPPDVSAAIVGPAFEGDVSAGLRQRIVERLTRGLRATGLATIAAERVRRALGPDAGSCTDEHCWRKLWVKLGARLIVGGRVAGNDRSYEIELWIADGRSGRRLAGVADRCEICGQRALADRIDIAASALRAKATEQANAPARLQVLTRPGGATLELDGKPAGKAPRELTLAVGSHRLAVRADGYQPVIRSIKAVSGLQERFEIRLTPDAPRRSPLRWWSYAGLGVGAAALGTGVALLALDGNAVDCGGATQVAGGQCARAWQSKAGGITLTSVGVAALLGGGYLLYRAIRDERAQRSRR